MIDSREYNDIVSWLNTYPNIEVFSRDGSLTYSSAITTSHPKAIQVSDRFHILKNLTSYCTNYLSKYLKDKIYIETENVSKRATKTLTNSQKNKMLSLKEKSIEAISMYKQGIIENKICKELNLDIRTLNKILNLNESDLDKALKLKISELNSFISGLKRDIDAIKNAIIYDYNNGLAEGCINKIKLIKRIMFGRCSFETLKTKVLNLEYYSKIN